MEQREGFSSALAQVVMLETMAYITTTVAPSHTVASSRLLRPLDDDGEDDDGNNGA